MPRIRMLVHGLVQGVFYRASVVERARELRVRGWVRNRSDGAVEVVAEGPQEKIDALRSYCAAGPPSAVVRTVDVSDEPETGEFASFSMRADA